MSTSHSREVSYRPVGSNLTWWLRRWCGVTSLPGISQSSGEVRKLDVASLLVLLERWNWAKEKNVKRIYRALQMEEGVERLDRVGTLRIVHVSKARRDLMKRRGPLKEREKGGDRLLVRDIPGGAVPDSRLQKRTLGPIST